MSTDRVIEILLALLSGVVGFVSFRLSTQAVAQQARSDRAGVDAGAYERARESYESALATVRGELVSCRAELSDTRAQVSELRADNERLHAELRTVRAELRQLRG